MVVEPTSNENVKIALKMLREKSISKNDREWLDDGHKEGQSKCECGRPIKHIYMISSRYDPNILGHLGKACYGYLKGNYGVAKEKNAHENQEYKLGEFCDLCEKRFFDCNCIDTNVCVKCDNKFTLPHRNHVADIRIICGPCGQKKNMETQKVIISEIEIKPKPYIFDNYSPVSLVPNKKKQECISIVYPDIKNYIETPIEESIQVKAIKKWLNYYSKK